MTSTVALQKCDEYDFEKVLTCVKKMFELVPPPDVRGKTVLLKPNILYPKAPELAVCTHPVVVGAAVRAFVDLGAARVIAGESPAIAGSATAAKATGMYDQVISLCRKLHIASLSSNRCASSSRSWLQLYISIHFG